MLFGVCINKAQFLWFLKVVTDINNKILNIQFLKQLSVFVVKTFPMLLKNKHNDYNKQTLHKGKYILFTKEGISFQVSLTQRLYSAC